MDAAKLIHRHGLKPHPEGGWYRELHRSAERVSRGDGAERSALTLILFLLQAGERSRWHRVSGAEETWQFSAGDPLELWLLPPSGGAPQCRVLATAERDPESDPVAVVPAGWWQAARPRGAWSLVSCCVAPGFEFADFSLLLDLPRDCWPAGAIAELL
jgi:predicted cupin superfamily sugar epimerase